LKFQGVYSVLPTPFRGDGSIDIASLERVVDLYARSGVNGLTALGVTSEVARLDESERQWVLDAVIRRVDGKLPVIAGTSADGLKVCMGNSLRAQSAGASAVMVSPPRLPKLNSDAVVNHYAGLAAGLSIDIVVQDYPPQSGYTMEPVLLARIAREVPKARTIKLEDPPTPLKTARILEACQGCEVSILGGLGGVYLLEELLAGAAGAMTGFAYPEMLVEVVTLFKTGEVKRAADAFYRYVPLMRFEFQQGIGMALRKEVLRRRGAIAEPAIRPPGIPLDARTREALGAVLGWMREKQGVEWISV
jgi:4-hydroxy-tetrahydrodipicolinate synthase